MAGMIQKAATDSSSGNLSCKGSGAGGGGGGLALHGQAGIAMSSATMAGSAIVLMSRSHL
jgi:hypothetical protein